MLCTGENAKVEHGLEQSKYRSPTHGRSPLPAHMFGGEFHGSYETDLEGLKNESLPIPQDIPKQSLCHTPLHGTNVFLSTYLPHNRSCNSVHHSACTQSSPASQNKLVFPCMHKPSRMREPILVANAEKKFAKKVNNNAGYMLRQVMPPSALAGQSRALMMRGQQCLRCECFRQRTFCCSAQQGRGGGDAGTKVVEPSRGIRAPWR